ncbi:hypothetical protein N0V90_009786 [Kalmusia sp. IMI 367209]|nr:hypothetical protein N0V90_009786 [Kalmusia sp. IMI 367209]
MFPWFGTAAIVKSLGTSSFAKSYPLLLSRYVSSSHLHARIRPPPHFRFPVLTKAMTTSHTAPLTNGHTNAASHKTEERPSTADESTQTNGFSEPHAGKLDKKELDGENRWSVESVLSEITTRYTESTNSPVPFFHLLERLKTTKRAGWRRFGIEHCESISDHMYRMSIITMMAPSSISSRLDILKCCRMALIHDMAESLVGDITPVDNVSKTEKSRRESETMDYICTNLLGKFNGGINGKELRAIWQEYEDSETLESQFVHDVDKVELISQMVEYEREWKGEKDLGEFTWVTKKIQSKEVRAWSDQLLWERLEMWKGFDKEPIWAEDTKPQSKPVVS